MAPEIVQVADVYVIESLAGGFAARTGLRLHDHLTSLIASSPNPKLRAMLQAHYHPVKSANEMSRLLQLIAVETARKHRSALLHLETHGSEDGLHLASGELVTWEDLRPALTEINSACDLNLIVIVAACIGLDLAKIILPTDRAPLRFIIGPNRVVSDREIEIAAHAFYSTLFESMNVRTAYDAMNDAIEPPSPDRKRVFHALSAQDLFKATMRMYFQQCRNEKDFVNRIETIVNGIAARRWNEHGVGTSWLERKHVRAQVRQYLSDHRVHFEESRTQFFQIDRSPVNAERFRISFEDCFTPESA